MLTAYTNSMIYDVRRDLIPQISPHILYSQSPYKFYGQPDGGPLTRPKHVVVSYISLLPDIVVFIDYIYIYTHTHTIYFVLSETYNSI